MIQMVAFSVPSGKPPNGKTLDAQICVSLRICTKRKPIEMVIFQWVSRICFFLLWCHQESNRGHKDFQSFALPTELWHHHFLFAVAKVGSFFDTAKHFIKKKC